MTNRFPFAVAALACATLMTVATTTPAFAEPARPVAAAKPDSHRVVAVRYGVSGPRRICLVRNDAPAGQRAVCLTERQWADRGVTVIEG